MKKALTAIALTTVLTSSALLSGQAFAVEGLSANVGATNNYLWRGVSQSTNAAAISGGIDYSAESGFYIGTWVSNADWADEMTYEMDIYGGFSGDLGEGFGYDVGYIYYAYDSDANSDFNEVYASISYDAFSVTYFTLIDSDAGGDFGDDSYISADAEFEVSKDLSLGLHIGRYDFDAGGDYTDYGVSLSKDGFTFTVSDTDIDGADGDVNFIISYSLDFDL
ncbi:TorF family putative porin [Colwelliaceae bacterium 6471]